MIFVGLFINVETKPKNYVFAKAKKEVIKAVSIDSEKVETEIRRLRQEKNEQKNRELVRQKTLDKKLKQARLKRKKEEQKLASLKRKARALELKRKKQKAIERQRLAQLKKQKEKAQKELQALAEKKALEQKQVERFQEQQKLEEKKRIQKQELAFKRKKEQERLALLKKEKEKQLQKRGVVNKYKALIINEISQNWILPDNVDKRLSSKFEIKIAPGGTVLSVKLIRSSGDAILDRSAQTAIYKASPLSVPSDPETFKLFKTVSLTVRPEKVVKNQS
jgi:colicin import membrane protein